MAGPQYRRSRTIRLRVVARGFATVAEPDLRVEVDHLIAGDRRILLAGTIAEIAAAAGVEPGVPGIYHDGSGATPDHAVEVVPADAAYLADGFERGGEGLRIFAPEQTPVLWPEHFDAAISLDEVNYGVSPGDGYLDEPYAYVGPWQPVAGPFWNAPFGAARPLRGLPDAGAVAAFFAEGRRYARA